MNALSHTHPGGEEPREPIRSASTAPFDTTQACVHAERENVIHTMKRQLEGHYSENKRN